MLYSFGVLFFIAISITSNNASYFASFKTPQSIYMQVNSSSIEFPEYHYDAHAIEQMAQSLMVSSGVNKSLNETFSASHKRVKRSFEYHVELVAYADASMIKHYGKRLKKYITRLVSMSAHQFRDPSIGIRINVKLIKIRLIRKSDYIINHESGITVLKTFCDWQKQKNKLPDSHVKHYDVAMLITRKFCRNAFKCGAVGYAYQGTICHDGACFLVEDHGMWTADIISHELGHVLGMVHNEDQVCAQKGFPLPPSFKQQRVAWVWSPCAKHFILEHLRNHGKCLLEHQKERKNLVNPLFRFSGLTFGLDKQCKMANPDYKFGCNIDTCIALWCKTDYHSSVCTTHNNAWADGTICGDKKWCDNGKCVTIPDSLQKHFY